MFISLAALAASAAVTDPDSSYPGTICHPWFLPSTDDPLVHGNTLLFNGGTSAITVTCPIVSKNPNSSGGIQFAGIWFTVAYFTRADKK